MRALTPLTAARDNTITDLRALDSVIQTADPELYWPNWTRNHWINQLNVPGCTLIMRGSRCNLPIARQGELGDQAHAIPLVGYIFYHTPKPHTAIIERLAVHPHHRRKGTGTLLLEAVINNYPTVILRVSTENLIAAQFLRSNAVPCICEHDGKYIFRNCR